MGVIRVGGVHGVGKTTIIHKALAITKIDIPILKGSDFMAEFIGVSPEELPFQDQERRQKARVYAYHKLQEYTIGIRDSHFCVYTDHGYEFPFDIRDKGNIVSAVLIYGSVELILKQRQKGARLRPLNPDLIQEQQEYEKRGAYHYAKELSIPLYEIQNIEGNDQCIRQFAEILYKYFQSDKE
ncbi:hypothetical protein U27_06274 [Candidatus Vecturithrix granuli]|uniref:Uncharacterized protein n=1 Tax=Vecturithrix granuli TaxID=1499967 RepID=A0A081C3Z2_VECG1|nr:hypothetical protein U27_06274 [Candidatus Vecturithrix granuli]